MEIIQILEKCLEQVYEEVPSISTSSWDEALRPTLVHGDLASHNVGLAADALILFDWELVAVADPAYDLGRLFRADLKQIGDKSEFLGHYWSHRRGKEGIAGFGRRLYVYERIAALEKAIWALRVVSRKEGHVGSVANEGMKLAKQRFIEEHVFDNIQFIGRR